MLSPVWACEGEQLTEPEGEAESSWCGPPLWLGRPGTFTTAHPLPRKRLEEAPLVTKAFREAQMKEKLQRYPKVPRGRGGGWCGLRTALCWGLCGSHSPQATGHGLLYFSPGRQGCGLLMNQSAPF